MLVVARHRVCQHRLQLPLPQDQHPVQQLTTGGADPPFRDGVGPRRLKTCAQEPDALGADDRIEAVGELGVPITAEGPELPDVVCQVHEQVASLLRDPPSCRVGRHPQTVDPAAGDLDHQQHIQALEQHRINMEEVASHDPRGLAGQQLPPGQTRAAPDRCRLA